MELPKYHEAFIPILETLNSAGALHYSDLSQRVRDKYYGSLNQELLSKRTTTGANVLLDRIGWAKSYLKVGKFVEYPSRGIVQITEKGKGILSTGKLSLDDLKNDADFRAHQEAKKVQKEGTVEEISAESASPQDLIDSGVLQIKNQVKSDLLDKLKDLNPYTFEKVVLVLLKQMGYGDFQLTAKSGDGGIDGVMSVDKLGLEKIYTQAKRYRDNKVREPEIRNFIGAMAGDANKGVFITTSTFDDSAVRKAKEAHHIIRLIDGEELVELMYEYGVGIQSTATFQIKQIDGDFFEVS